MMDWRAPGSHRARFGLRISSVVKKSSSVDLWVSLSVSGCLWASLGVSEGSLGLPKLSGFRC